METSHLSPIPPAITGLQLLNSAKVHQPFSTGHEQLDLILSEQPHLQVDKSSTSLHHPIAGLSRHQLVQIDGPPGSGKTKLVIGISIRARASSLKSKDHVEILFIDADGSLHPALIRKSVYFLVKTDPIYKSDKENFNENLINQICDGLHLVRITTTAELGLFLRNLNNWLNSHPKVKLVILDSITAHTRYVSMSINHRKTISKIIKDSLTRASSLHDCTVIVTSQLTTKSINYHHQLTSSYSNNKQHTLSQQKLLIAPDFKANQWYKQNNHLLSSSFSSVSNNHKKIKINHSNLMCKFWKIGLMFKWDGSRICQVLENDRILEPKSGVLFDINEIGIFDPFKNIS